MGWAIAAVLAIIVCWLGIKVYLLRKSAKLLRHGLEEKLREDTNTLLCPPTRDREMRRLAAALNQQLRILRQERLRYQQGDRELKEEVANLAHDLRTPLTALCGYLELLQTQALSRDAARYLAQIQNRANTMRQLTEDLFRYSLAHIQQPLNMKPVNLTLALEEALLAFYGSFEKKGILPQIQLPDNKVERILDPAALERILGNILENALKYSGDNLAVTLSQEGTITFSNRAPDLDQTTAGRLCNRFYTVEAGQNATGLGLSIAKLLTQRMGGEMGIQFEKGTLSVWVTFPKTDHPGP